MSVLVIILGVIIIGLSIYISKLNKSIKEISKSIEENRGEYINIRTDSSNQNLELLVERVNDLYDESQSINAENKRIEEEIRRSIANMSHDLRTPLTSVMGYIQLLEDENLSGEERKEYTKVIKRRTENLQKLVTSFFDLSRLNSGEYKFNYKKVEIKDILCDTVATYYNDFVSTGIEPTIEIDENISEMISDEGAISRVFSNLIGNMIKHGDGDFKIELKEEEGYILSRFSNRAKYIDEDKVNKLFDRFYTADSSRNDRNTGLGLSIAKTFVEKLGNQINAKYIKKNLVIEIRWQKK
ncbi:MAG: histidine kinase dimerization/phospho-acceptor domain-containing protein [Sarcina sp.]